MTLTVIAIKVTRFRTLSTPCGRIGKKSGEFKHLYCSLYTGSGRVPSGSRIWAKHNAGFGKTQNLCCWRDLDASLEAGFTKIRLFRRDFLQVDSSRCPCNRSVRSFGLTERLMIFTRPGKDRIGKTKKLRLLTKKSAWKVSATRLLELQRKIYGNNGHLWKKSCFSGWNIPSSNSSTIRWNPSLIPVPGFRDRFSVKGTGFCVPFTQTVNRPVFPCDGVRIFDVFHKQNVLNERRSDKSESKDLTKLRRRRQQERQKSKGLMSKIATLHVHHAFLYISLPSLHN